MLPTNWGKPGGSQAAGGDDRATAVPPSPQRPAGNRPRPQGVALGAKGNAVGRFAPKDY
ncbi:MAG: hypothetical protein KDD89_00725 [Anaerolineales bacterium]|nr:hypothetical protein [Anaerolineales bacterium]